MKLCPLFQMYCWHIAYTRCSSNVKCKKKKKRWPAAFFFEKKKICNLFGFVGTNNNTMAMHRKAQNKKSSVFCVKKRWLL